MSTRSSPLSLTPPATGRGMALGALLTGTLLVLAFLPPFLAAEWRHLLMQGLQAVCHQLPSRTFHLDGVPMGVCHRCTGIYIGLFAGVLIFPLLSRYDMWLWRNAPGLVVGSLVPMGLDWLGDALGLFANTPLSRVLTGAAFGGIVSYLLVRGLAGLFLSPDSENAAARVTPAAREP